MNYWWLLALWPISWAVIGFLAGRYNMRDPDGGELLAVAVVGPMFFLMVPFFALKRLGERCARD